MQSEASVAVLSLSDEETGVLFAHTVDVCTFCQSGSVSGAVANTDRDDVAVTSLTPPSAP